MSIAPALRSSPTRAIAAPRIFLLSNIWQAPLVPVALTGTAGIILDRHFSIPIVGSLLAAAGFLAAWGIGRLGGPRGLALVYLWLSVGALGAAYHHWYRDLVADDDIRHYASDEPRLARLRGDIATEPAFARGQPSGPFRAVAGEGFTHVVLRVTQLERHGAWQTVSGKAGLIIAGRKDGLDVGAKVEIVGQMVLPGEPANPGESDDASLLRDQQIGALVIVRKSADGIIVLAPGAGWYPRRVLAHVRTWGIDVLQTALPSDEAALARALLLGDGAAMHYEDWEKYRKTGVIHALAISGQHLVVLGGFAWWVLRVAGVGRRSRAITVALFLLSYALLAGGRPPVMRSAYMVIALCGGVIVQRPVLPANSFALAWIIVALGQPTDMFTPGCQLSFLAVAVIFWGTSGWGRRDIDPLERLLDESRPFLERCLRGVVRLILLAYAVNLAVWLAVTPLLAARFHVVAPVALLIGPPVVLLTSLALILGFVLLLLAPVVWPVAVIAGAFTRWSLTGCSALVDWAVQCPIGYWYVPDLAEWWLWVFYAGLLAALTVPPLRPRWRWTLAGGVLWLAVWVIGDLLPRRPGEFRCTFLAVGHGGCTVMETPDGRTLVYDAGAITGPEVTRRQIAPFLWQRGIRRIDELFLSHADLDHFNGVIALLERFPIGQMTCTPSFVERPTGAVRLTLDALRERGVAVRITKAGDRLTAGPITFDVLHPPRVGPEGNENARSMVLLVQHADHSILLTGDLDGLGRDRVLALPPVKVDILMAPHHGGVTANTPELAKWARASVVVSSQRRPLLPRRTGEVYEKLHAEFLATSTHGAVTIRSSDAGLMVQTHLTGTQRQVR